MKISKIACVALLGASFAVSGVFADAKSDYENALKARKDVDTNYEKKEGDVNKAVQTITQSVNTLRGIKAKLKAWDGTNTGNDNKEVYNAVKKISDALESIKPSAGEVKLVSQDKASTLSIDSTGRVTLTIAGAEHEAITTTLKLDESKLTDADSTAIGNDKISKIFAEKNSNVWNEFINAFPVEHNKQVENRAKELEKDRKTKDEDIVTKAIAYNDSDTTGKVATQNFDAFSDAYAKNIEIKKADLEAKKTASAQKVTELANDDTKFTKKPTSIDQLLEQEKAVDAALAELKKEHNTGSAEEQQKAAKKAAITQAINAGIPVKDKTGTTDVDLTKLAGTDYDNDLDAIIGTNDTEGARKAATDAQTAITAVTGEVKTAQAAVEKAKIDSDNFANKVSGKATKIASEELTTYKTTLKEKTEAIDAAKKAKPAKDQALSAEVTKLNQKTDKTFTLKGTSAKDITEQAGLIEAAKTAAQDISDDDKKKAAIVAAIKAGVVVKNGDKTLAEADVEKLSTGDLATVATKTKTDAEAAVTAIAEAKAKAAAVTEEETKITEGQKAISDSQKELRNTSYAKAKAVAKVEKLTQKEGDVLLSLADAILDNAKVQDLIAGYDTATSADKYHADDVADVARSLNNSFEQSFEALNKGTVANTINFSTSLATSTRLAKLSNPFNENLALASAISKLEGEKFADNGNSLSSVVKEYTNRYNYDNNLWGNISGGKAKLKGSANQDFYGFTLGYDKAFDNTIVGGYFNYTKVEADASQVESKSNNYSLGVYSRSYFGQNELDATLSYGIGKNDLTRKSLNALVGDTTGKYDSKFFGISVDYGYVFGIGNAKFIKPIFGLEYSFIKNDEFKENGGLPANFKATATKVLSAKLAAEFRAYADNGSYFYITPGLQRELAKSVDDGVISFVGSTKEVKYLANKEKATFFTLKTGAEFKITNNLSTNVNFGAKAKSKEQYYNGTVGLSYKF
jgi:hypothetical protein